MSFENPWWLLAAGFAVALGIWMLSHTLSRDARLGRRRRRSHSRLEPRDNRPMVKLSARTRSKPKR